MLRLENQILFRKLFYLWYIKILALYWEELWLSTSYLATVFLNLIIYIQFVDFLLPLKTLANII